ncbi:MAG TPA: hypothetical protein DCZ10_16955 [Pelotomaculum sp.]|nr:hypothetical protein [Pelotomaculum sp.]
MSDVFISPAEQLPINIIKNPMLNTETANNNVSIICAGKETPKAKAGKPAIRLKNKAYHTPNIPVTKSSEIKPLLCNGFRSPLTNFIVLTMIAAKNTTIYEISR